MRVFGAVVLGYIAIVIVVFCGLSLGYMTLGADRTFHPGVYDVSSTWVTLSIVVGLIAAIVGGWVAYRIARGPAGPRSLALVVLILGLVLALPAIGGSPEAVAERIGLPGMIEAMESARTPLWVMLLNPVIGAIGVMLGGRFARDSD